MGEASPQGAKQRGASTTGASRAVAQSVLRPVLLAQEGERQQVLEPVEDCSPQNRPRQLCLPIQSTGLRLYLIPHQVESVPGALIEPDFGRRIGRLAAVSGEAE